MEERKLTAGILKRFREELVRRDRSDATVEKYMHDVRSLAVWLDGGAVTPERVLEWKKELTGRFKPGTVNGKLAAANALFAFAGWGDCRLESLKVQRRAFREDARELSREEFYRLVNAAGRLGKERLLLLLEAIAGTGIRVSEVKYLTVEAARQGVAEIALKGKIRTILLPGKLCRKLLQYARKQKKRLRRDFSHQKREADEPETDLGGDEGAEQKSRGPARQGLPPQPPAPVCADVLPGDAGRGQTGGRPRAFEPDNDADLPDFDRRRAPEGAGKAETHQLDGRNILSQNKGQNL